MCNMKRKSAKPFVQKIREPHLPLIILPFLRQHLRSKQIVRTVSFLHRMSARIIKNQRGGDTLIDDQNYSYTKNKKINETQTWRCTKYSSVRRCTASVKTPVGQPSVILSKQREHNHLSNISKVVFDSINDNLSARIEVIHTNTLDR